MANLSLFECNDKVIPAYILLLRLVDFAEQQGIKPDLLLKGTKLFYHDLLDTKLMVSFDQIESCITNLYKQLPYNELSFQIGQHYFGNGNMSFETALLNANNLNDVLRIIKRFSFNAFPFVQVQNYLSSNHYHVAVSPGIKQSSYQHELFFYEMFLSAISMFLSWRFPYVTIDIELPYSRPKHIEQYQSYLKYPCQFDRPLFLITINKNALNTVQQGASVLLRKQAMMQLAQEKQLYSLLCQLHSLVLSNPSTTLEQAAETLRISPATLKRKLKSHNSSFKHEKDLTLKQYTLFHLTQNDASNQELSNNLAINDLTNFRSMFKRWTGKTPNELRFAR
jgi:AraC-like DNA-binding protein